MVSFLINLAISHVLEWGPRCRSRHRRDKVWTRRRPPARRSSPPRTKRRSTRRGSSYVAAVRTFFYDSARLFAGSRRRSRPRFYILSTAAPAGRPARSSHRIRLLSWAAASYLLRGRRSPGALVWAPLRRLYLLWMAAAPFWAASSMASGWCSLLGSLDAGAVSQIACG